MSLSSSASAICRIIQPNLEKFVLSLVRENTCETGETIVLWDECGWHLSPSIASDSACAQYCLVLDALNFCFWPNEGLEYEHLACGLRDAYLADNHCFDADRLSCCSEETLKSWVSKPCELPNLEERVARVREI